MKVKPSKKLRALVAVSMMAATVICATSAIADFTSAQGGNWSDPATWGGAVPDTGASVTIASGHTVTVDVETDAVGDVQVSGTLSFDGWDSLLRARDVTVAGTVTHGLNTATTTNSAGAWEPNARVNIACTNLSVVSNGKIDVNAKGYAGAQNNNIPAAGPGAGSATSIGGGHGGNGGRSSEANGGLAYDTPEAPSQPGSGGGHGTGVGGNGGGVVKITASGSVSVAGNILANGGNGVLNFSAGGAGGSVHIICETFLGAGTISANGGGGLYNVGAGGGGGCIAIDYDPVAQAGIPLPAARIVTLGGTSNSDPAHPVEYIGEVGTLWFPDNQFLTRVTADDIVRLGGRWVDQTFTAWNVDALTLDHGWLRFTPPGFRLNVAGNLSVLGSGVTHADRSNARIYRLELTDGIITCGGDMLLKRASVILYSDAPGTAVVCDGDVMIHDRSLLYVYSAATNGVMPDFTASVTVGGRMAIETDSWIYPLTGALDPAPALFTAADFFIDATSGINASLQGYNGATNTGSATGFGPGFGVANAGASHGGWGGGNSNGGAPYGSVENPVTFGSGGGGGNNVNTTARGGGVIRLVATGRVVLNGKLNAYGGNGNSNHCGAGSGGSINIICDTFWGTNGVAGAYGGNGTGAGNIAGGAGGRIAVRYNPASQAGVPVPDVALSVRGGSGLVDDVASRYGDSGTLWFPDDQLLVRATTIRHSGLPVISGFTRWDAGELAFENCWFRLPDGLELNVAGTLTLSGTGATTIYGDQLEASNAVIRCGSLVLQQSVGLVVKPGETNMDGAPYAGLVDVAGAMVVGPGSWVYPCAHPYNGGVVFFRADSLDIDATGGFNANRLGYIGGAAMGFAGNGPGGGRPAANAGGGGGYGGRGATHASQASASGGIVYGLKELPIQPGSGGSGSAHRWGGYGGGLVWAQVRGEVVLHGTISANGGKGAGYLSGDGSGGGILIDCRTFSGSGTLAADGGATANANSANGGGGRIAVWEKITDTARTSFMAGNFRSAIEIDQPEAFTGKADVECGEVGREGGEAHRGTVVFLTSAPEGTRFILR